MIGFIAAPGTKSEVFSASLEAVVDHDGHHGHGDRQSRHPGKDGPDTPNSIVDDGANHRTISTGNLRAVNTEIAAESFSWPLTSSDRDGC